MAEKDILRNIIGYLEYNNIWWERLNSGAQLIKNNKGEIRNIRMAKKGAPDIIACYNGLFMGIEIKKDKKEYENWRRIAGIYRTTKEQKKSWQHIVDQHNYAMDMINNGAEYVLTYDTGHFDEVFKKLKIKYKI